MSSGCYFPSPVKTVEIPKTSGGKRILGIPMVTDRIAQMVVKLYFEPDVEPYFCQDSYGYRTGKSPLDAIAITRQRCWKYDWVLEFDIKALFDTINHELLMSAVTKHTDSQWIILYITNTGRKTYQYIFETWLTSSEYALDHRPYFEILGEKYKNDDPSSEEEIWIAITPKKLKVLQESYL